MKKSKLMTKDERAFQVAAVIVLGVLSLCAILPFVLIFIASFTEEKTLTQYGYTFFPRKLSLDAYKYLANNFATIGRAYITSILSLIHIWRCFPRAGARGRGAWAAKTCGRL